MFVIFVLFSCWPFPSLTLGDLLCFSILDLVRILGSTGGWFSVIVLVHSLVSFVSFYLVLGKLFSVRHSEPVPICSVSQRTKLFVGPLASPKMVSLRPDLGVLNQLRFNDPDHFRAGMIHHSLPVWESLLADFNCSSVDLLEIVQDGVRVERFFRQGKL